MTHSHDNSTDHDHEHDHGDDDVVVAAPDGPIAGYTRGQRPDVIDTGDPLVDELIDGLLMNRIYTSGEQITYTFGLTDDLAADDAITVLNQASIDRHLQVFAEVTALTGVPFVEVDALEQDANLYFYFREGTGTAYVTGYRGGVAHVYNPDRDTPVLGGYVDHLILHELGHGLGLAHGHDLDALPADFQGHSWSVMSYRPHPDTSTLAFATQHGPETFMLADIAALQFQFGANFDHMAGDTVYSVNFGTGELLIDGVSQGVPNNVRMQRAIWDGGGTDTLDLSGGPEAMTITLQPGAFTSLGDRFRIDTTREGLYFAEGNLANPYLYQGITASLLDNVIAGDFDDEVTGNLLGNSLSGGDGADSLYGLEGDDTLLGGADNDLIIDGLGNTTAQGDAENDVVIALSGQSDLQGNAGDDVLIGGIDVDVLDGGAGDDVIRGEAGLGMLFGNDTITGGADDDLLMGGRGADQFVFNPNDGTDVIATFDIGDTRTAINRDIDPIAADFEFGTDTILLVGFVDVTAEDVMEFVTDGADGAVFAAQGTSVTFFGVDADDLSATDFVF